MLKVTSKDGTQITYDKRGQGPALILVLGALNKRGSGKKLTELLVDDFTVVSYDRRGRGDSGDTKPYSVDKEIDDIGALIDELGGSAYVYGHSSGAILALQAAEKLDKKVIGLALYEVPYNDDPQAQKIAEQYKKNLKQFLSADKRGDAIALFVTSVGVSEKQISAMQKLPMWKGLTAMAPTLLYDTVELMESYPNVKAQNVTTKSLVMYGGASPSFMAKTAQKLSQAMPHSTLRSLENQTHDVKSGALAPVLIEFFK
ncbi:MAG: alpha/beta hydrolase fold protein [Candidatus Saccharibacteria bacterium]|nr:alpha/beta hydrolase fold protein [Candidatus Saccharibacteria bacterium]